MKEKERYILGVFSLDIFSFLNWGLSGTQESSGCSWFFSLKNFPFLNLVLAYYRRNRWEKHLVLLPERPFENLVQIPRAEGWVCNGSFAKKGWGNE